MVKLLVKFTAGGIIPVKPRVGEGKVIQQQHRNKNLILYHTKDYGMIQWHFFLNFISPFRVTGMIPSPVITMHDIV